MYGSVGVQHGLILQRRIAKGLDLAHVQLGIVNRHIEIAAIDNICTDGLCNIVQVDQ